MTLRYEGDPKSVYGQRIEDDNKNENNPQKR